MKPRKGSNGWGMVYLPRGRGGKPSRWYWIRFQFPGETGEPHRYPTNPRTDDEREAKRQLYERMGERAHVRVRRQAVEDLTVNDILDLYILDCEDNGYAPQVGRVEVWRTALGNARAVEVEREHLDALCRRWKKAGPTWTAGERVLADGRVLTWKARDPRRVRPIGDTSCNRYVAALVAAYSVAKEKKGLQMPFTPPHYEEHGRGEYITEDQSLDIFHNFKARFGADVKARVFRLAYLLGIRKGQLRNTRKSHVLILAAGSEHEQWRLKWPEALTKNGEPHEVVLLGEALDIVRWAWERRRLDCEHLFHVNGKPLGPMRSELARTCATLGIPYGRGKGIVFHDTRHSAVTNLTEAGVSDEAGMSITGHKDQKTWRGYNVRRSAAQVAALQRMADHLASQRGTATARHGTTRGA